MYITKTALKLKTNEKFLALGKTLDVPMVTKGLSMKIDLINLTSLK